MEFFQVGQLIAHGSDLFRFAPVADVLVKEQLELAVDPSEQDAHGLLLAGLTLLRLQLTYSGFAEFLVPAVEELPVDLQRAAAGAESHLPAFGAVARRFVAVLGRGSVREIWRRDFPPEFADFDTEQYPGCNFRFSILISLLVH